MDSLRPRFGMVLLLVLVSACGDDDGGGSENEGPTESPEQTGKSCEVVDDCYPDVDHEALSGAVQCLDRVRDGYCTHLCETDADCCAADGECETDLRQVCSPFESTGQKMCFLSCEGDDLRNADGGVSTGIDEQEFCQREASTDFICRSSGGGSENRKVCVPGGCTVGASCDSDDDCDPGLECVDELGNGYCSIRDCVSNADCTGDSACVELEGAHYCLRGCTIASQCSFCRPLDDATTCTDEVTLVEATDTRVCLP